MVHWLDILHKQNEYTKTAVDMAVDKHAAPEVQLEQAIQAAKSQHDLLQDQAAAVLGDEKLAEQRWQGFNNQVDEKKQDAAAALKLAAKYADGTPEKDRYTRAAQIAAGQVVSLQAQADRQHDTYLHATQMADEARKAIQKNSEDLQTALQRRAELVNDLHDTEMEETLHSTMQSLQKTAEGAVPTLDQVAEKIQARKAKQDGYSEIAADSPDDALDEVHHAAQLDQANTVLADISAQLGLDKDQKTQAAGA